MPDVVTTLVEAGDMTFEVDTAGEREARKGFPNRARRGWLALASTR